MPFTLAHPAAALPLTKLLGRFGCPAALAIGSMMPDLPFFLGVKLAREHTHGLASLLSWSLPTGLIMYLLFQTMFRQALIDLAPDSVQQRIGHAQSAAPWTAVALSLLIGAATHLFWDAFTHPGLFVQSLPVLQMKLGSAGTRPLYIFKILQHASTAFGLMLLTAWAWRWHARTPPLAVTPALSPGTRSCICLALIAMPLAAGIWASGKRNWDVASFIFTTLPVCFWMLTLFALTRRAR